MIISTRKDFNSKLYSLHLFFFGGLCRNIQAQRPFDYAHTPTSVSKTYFTSGSTLSFFFFPPVQTTAKRATQKHEEEGNTVGAFARELLFRNHVPELHLFCLSDPVYPQFSRQCNSLSYPKGEQNCTSKPRKLHTNLKEMIKQFNTKMSQTYLKKNKHNLRSIQWSKEIIEFFGFFSSSRLFWKEIGLL